MPSAQERRVLLEGGADVRFFWGKSFQNGIIPCRSRIYSNCLILIPSLQWYSSEGEKSSVSVHGLRRRERCVRDQRAPEVLSASAFDHLFYSLA